MNSSEAARAKRLLDIAAKYQVEGARPFIVNQLTAHWPDRKLSWVLLREGQKTASLVASSTPWVSILEEEDDHLFWEPGACPDPALAIRIALDHNVPSVLPAAFYSLCQIDFRADYKFWCLDIPWQFHPSSKPAFADGWNFYKDSADDEPLARLDVLDGDTLYRLEVGKRFLLDSVLTASSVFMERPKKKCRSPDDCQAQRKRLRDRYRLDFSSETDSIHKPDPLDILWAWWRNPRLTEGLCKKCSDRLRENVWDEMDFIWKELPAAFLLDTLKPGACS